MFFIQLRISSADFRNLPSCLMNPAEYLWVFCWIHQARQVACSANVQVANLHKLWIESHWCGAESDAGRSEWGKPISSSPITIKQQNCAVCEIRRHCIKDCNHQKFRVETKLYPVLLYHTCHNYVIWSNVWEIASSFFLEMSDHYLAPVLRS